MSISPVSITTFYSSEKYSDHVNHSSIAGEGNAVDNCRSSAGLNTNLYNLPVKIHMSKRARNADE